MTIPPFHVSPPFHTSSLPHVPQPLPSVPPTTPATAVGLPPTGGVSVPAALPGLPLPPATTVGDELLGGGGDSQPPGASLPASGSSILMLTLLRRAPGCCRTGSLGVVAALSPSGTAAPPLSLRRATMTWPSVLVPMIRAWADWESKGLSGVEDWRNCRMVAPSGV